MVGGHHIRSWDDYFIPGTRVLRNKFDEADPVRLAAREEAPAKIRLVGLARTPIPGNFDYAHMKAIHRAILQDVYDWAGLRELLRQMHHSSVRYKRLGVRIDEMTPA